VNIHAVKTRFSRLVDAAEIVISRAGKPVAKLVPLAPVPAKPARALGALAGRLLIPADFDAPLPEDELARFEGR
jgi:antitoxin (DNA-binding transcriptional repressor) of toxin-antitoxin stability system